MEFYEVDSIADVLESFRALGMELGALDDEEDYLDLVVEEEPVTNFMPCSLFIIILVAIYFLYRRKSSKKKHEDDKQLKKQMSALEKQLAAVLGEKKNLEAENSKLKNEKDKLADWKAQFQVRDCENQKKIRKLENENSQLKEQKSKCQKELTAKTKAVEELVQTVNQLKAEHQERQPDRTSRNTSSPSTSGSQLSEQIRETLYELQSARSRLLQEKQNDQTDSKIRRLIGLTEDPEMKRGANVERLKFNIAFEKYMTAVDANINMIQNNPNITIESLPKLPEFPTLSSGFLRAYELVVNKKSSDDEVLAAVPAPQPEDPTEIADKECVICLKDMTSREETIKCANCRRRYHHGCATKWFATNSTCPVCKITMWDPRPFS